MASVNKVILIGNLGADPEVRFTPGGQAVCEIRLATNEQWVDKQGAKQEKTEWHRIVVWGKQAENCGKYLAKGRTAYFEGRLQTRQWDDKEGNKRYTTEIVADRVQFLGGGKNEGGQQRSATPSSGGGSKPADDGWGGGVDPGTTSGGVGPGADDDIPF